MSIVGTCVHPSAVYRAEPLSCRQVVIGCCFISIHTVDIKPQGKKRPRPSCVKICRQSCKIAYPSQPFRVSPLLRGPYFFFFYIYIASHHIVWTNKIASKRKVYPSLSIASAILAVVLNSAQPDSG